LTSAALFHPPPDLARVVVVGTSGAGKSTTGAKLAQVLGHPFVELDELFWGPGWQPKPARQFLRLTRAATSGERWVVAGNYGAIRPEVWPRASAVIWLNFRLAVILRRLIARTARRVLSREVLWHGNRESAVRTLFTRESIVWWAITTHNRRTAQLAEIRAAATYPHLRWYEFTQPSEVERFLAAAAPHVERQATP
jgi:adenylate kinase family enzyme